MNYAIVFRLLGYVMLIEGALLLLPAAASWIYGEWFVLGVFLITAAVSAAIGYALRGIKPKSKMFYMREGFAATSLSWIVISIVGAVPFVVAGCIPNPVDALFETVSGFTTTGASILPGVEDLPKGILFWRSFTHWIGGMGVLVFLLAVIPLSGGSNMNLMRAESPGPSVGKLVPKVKHTARILYLIYLGMTILQVLFLLAGKLPLFDALTTTFGTAGTGGFAIKNDSMMSYTAYQQWVYTIFMALFGVNFNAYYLILFGKFKKAFAMEEVRWYFIIIFCSTAFIFFQILDSYSTAFEALTHAAFQVSTIITTTGFATTDFNLWPAASRTVLVLLMFIGACAGSTGGGIKVSRCVVMVKSVVKEMGSYLHPNSVKKIKLDGKPVDHEVLRSINVFFITYMIIFASSVFLVSLEGRDMVTNFTAVAATFNNIGPGLEGVGPTQNFGALSILSKYTLMFDMLAGRLELFPLLLLFHPGVWKETFAKKIKETSAQYH